MSPLANGKYPANTKCQWKIKMDVGSQIRLNFTEMKLEASVACSKDYVLVRNGDETDSPVIGRYCGSTLPDAILSPGHEMMIEFSSDASIENSGFQLTYEKVIQGNNLLFSAKKFETFLFF